MNEQASATHGAHEDERWREAKRRRIRELETEVERLRVERDEAVNARDHASSDAWYRGFRAGQKAPSEAA